MTAEQFAYWFQGFAELSPTPPTPEQWQSMRDHVAAVFKKVTPPVAAPAPRPSAFEPKPADLGEVIKREFEKRGRQEPSPFKKWPDLAPADRYTLIC